MPSESERGMGVNKQFVVVKWYGLIDSEIDHGTVMALSHQLILLRPDSESLNARVQMRTKYSGN